MATNETKNLIRRLNRALPRDRKVCVTRGTQKRLEQGSFYLRDTGSGTVIDRWQDENHLWAWGSEVLQQKGGLQ